MTKYFCDRCQKEVNSKKLLLIPDSDFSYPSGSNKVAWELCKECLESFEVWVKMNN
jgi:hypothetical protein